MSCLNSTEKNSTRNKRVSLLTIIAALLSIILASPATAVVYLDVDGTSEPITYTEEQQDLPKTIVDTNDSLKVVFKSFAPVGYTVNVTTSIFFKTSLTGAKFGTSHPTVTAAGTTWFPMVGGQGFSNATVGVTAYESTITVTETSFRDLEIKISAKNALDFGSYGQKRRQDGRFIFFQVPYLEYSQNRS